MTTLAEYRERLRKRADSESAQARSSETFHQALMAETREALLRQIADELAEVIASAQSEPSR